MARPMKRDRDEMPPVDPLVANLASALQANKGCQQELSALWSAFSTKRDQAFLLDAHLEDGSTLMHLAAGAGHSQAVNTLLQLGAQPNVVHLNFFETPLDLALKLPQPIGEGLVSLMRNLGAQTYSQLPTGQHQNQHQQHARPTQFHQPRVATQQVPQQPAVHGAQAHIFGQDQVPTRQHQHQDQQHARPSQFHQPLPNQQVPQHSALPRGEPATTPLAQAYNFGQDRLPAAQPPLQDQRIPSVVERDHKETFERMGKEIRELEDARRQHADSFTQLQADVKRHGEEGAELLKRQQQLEQLLQRLEQDPSQAPAMDREPILAAPRAGPTESPPTAGGAPQQDHTRSTIPRAPSMVYDPTDDDDRRSTATATRPARTRPRSTLKQVFMKDEKRTVRCVTTAVPRSGCSIIVNAHYSRLLKIFQGAQKKFYQVEFSGLSTTWENSKLWKFICTHSFAASAELPLYTLHPRAQRTALVVFETKEQARNLKREFDEHFATVPKDQRKVFVVPKGADLSELPRGSEVIRVTAPLEMTIPWEDRDAMVKKLREDREYM